MKTIRVLLADDHALIRSGLRLLIEAQPDLTVAGEAGDGREAIRQAAALAPDVAVLDIAMPNLNGIEAARQISSELPRTGIVILSMHRDESYVLRALKAGARGYILKDGREGELVEAIHAVAAGKAYFSPDISRLLADDYVRALAQRGLEDSYELLTAREREIFQMLTEGRTNKDIAAALDLSLYTVETHRGNLMQKLSLRSLPELILYAVRKGLIV